MHTPILGGGEWKLHLHKVSFGGVFQASGGGPAGPNQHPMLHEGDTQEIKYYLRPYKNKY